MKPILIGLFILCLLSVSERIYNQVCDRELRRAVINRNMAEQHYYETATKQQELETKTLTGTVISTYEWIQKNKKEPTRGQKEN